MKPEIIIALLFLGTIAGTTIGYLMNKFKLKYIMMKALKRIRKQKLKGDGVFKDLPPVNTRLSEGSDLPKREEEIVKGASPPPLPPDYFEYKNLKDGKK